MKMEKTILLVSLLLLWAAQAWSLPYMGTLTSSTGAGLYANPTDGDWANGGSSFSWGINYNPTTELWTYDYTWTGEVKALSHIIVQLSDTFTIDNIFAGTTDFNEDDLKKYTAGPSNPGLPGDLFGVKFESNSTVFNFTIVTDRDPIWGNIYAKDGVDNQTTTSDNEVYAYNTGFLLTAPTFDGVYDDGIFNIDGALYGWALVPDTTNGGGGTGDPVPEPGTIVLVGAGLVGLALLRKKQSK